MKQALAPSHLIKKQPTAAFASLLRRLSPLPERRAGNLLLRKFLRPFLAQEARPHARPDLQQRDDQSRRGAALRLRVLALPLHGEQAESGDCAGDHQGGGRGGEELHLWGKGRAGWLGMETHVWRFFMQDEGCDTGMMLSARLLLCVICGVRDHAG